MQTVLDAVTQLYLNAEPFPHIVVPDVLNNELYCELLAHYPSVEVITRGATFSSNERFSLPAAQIIRCPHITKVWRDFIEAHTSKEFVFQMAHLFREYLPKDLSLMRKVFDIPPTIETGVRELDNFSRADILLDAQICINTPVEHDVSAVRRVHVDTPDKLFVGLYYMRHPEDRSKGGDLEICKFKKTPKGFHGAEIDDSYVSVVKTVPYESNVLVMFLNGIRSLHGVTIRSVTSMPRYFVNFVATIREDLFNLNDYQEPPLSRRLRAGKHLVASRLLSRFKIPK